MKNNFWNMLKEVESAYNFHRRKVMNKYSLSAIEVDVMVFLANNGGLNTAADIVSVRKISKSHVSLATDELYKKGYICKKVDSANRKRICLFITPKADEIVRYGQEQQEEFMKKIGDGFSEDEKRQFFDSFDRIIDNVRRFYNVKPKESTD